MVNYFKYKYPQPKGDDPFSVSTEMADCPWQPGHKLLRVGVQGKEIHRAERPASNIVFLIDTSGSMTDQNKLPLLKQAFTMLVGELNENDKVTIVTYAGNAGLRLPPTRGHEKETIIAAIEGMQSGGSTHGSAGISLAYEVASAQFIKGGTNKVILATDGDLNVGITDDAQLVDLITKKAKSGVYLTVLGVGTGNLKDAKMERLADNGNGVYAYLDTVKEARKVLVEEMSGSLVTIAKDVKIQVEFNPNHVHSYRLLGYENRVMANKDFENDQKDAGEIGAGHSVTAMYEVVLVGADKNRPESKTDAEPAEEPLRYQRPMDPEKGVLTDAGKSDELLIVKLRYKTPEAKDEDKAKQLNFPLNDKGGSFNSASKEFQFASSVVAFGLTLRNSEYRGSANFSAVAEIASATLGEDVNGHRAEFVELVKRAKTLRGE
jgi:Ca-activated chloride channel family protein